MPTLVNIINEICRLVRLDCYGCCAGYPDEHWLHSFGCNGCISFIIDVKIDKALQNLHLADIIATENEKEQLKTLIAIYY